MLPKQMLISAADGKFRRVVFQYQRHMAKLVAFDFQDTFDPDYAAAVNAPVQLRVELLF